MRKEWMNSIVTKFMSGFGLVILSTSAAFLLVYHHANELARELMYEKMYSQAEFFLQSFDKELSHVHQLQMDFFNDRKLTFIINPNTNIDAYEKRDCLLSVRERIETTTGVSNLVEKGILYLPKSGYEISSGGIHDMSDEAMEKMLYYMEYADGQLHYDGSSFFIVETGVPRIQSNSIPNHVFVIFFSEEQMVENLSLVNTSRDSGSFWYNETEELLIEHSEGDAVGDSILPLLKMDPSGKYANIQRINVEGKDYLILVGGRGELGWFVQYVQEETVMRPVTRLRNLEFIALGLITILTIILGINFGISLHQPINALLKGFRRVQQGNWKEPIKEIRRDEFSYLYKGFNDMQARIERLINEVYVQTNLTQRAQMKQLQSQIAPHFLYNSFFLLSRRIKREDYENAELLAKHLGTYFQYLARNEADYLPLKLEINYTRSYAAIQEARFAGRIRIEFEAAPPAFEDITVPRLILQPLLENAFEYALEDKVADGLLRIRFEETREEWRIWVEDNGDGISDEKLREISHILVCGKQGEITGIYNIHMRLQNYFHGNGGLKVQRSEFGGMAVYIYIEKEEGYERDAADCG